MPFDFHIIALGGRSSTFHKARAYVQTNQEGRIVRLHAVLNSDQPCNLSKRTEPRMFLIEVERHVGTVRLLLGRSALRHLYDVCLC